MMNQEPEKFSPDDPRLTAYALGELEGAERAAVEAALREDAALRAMLEEIRATVAQLEGALATEALPAAAEFARPAAKAKLPLRGVLLRFPQAYFLVSGLAAACFVVFVIVRDPGERPAPAAVADRKVVTVLNLPPLETAAADAEKSDVRAPVAPEAPAVVAVIPRAVPMATDSSLRVTNEQVAKNLATLGKDLSLLGQTGTLDPRMSLTVADLPTGNWASSRRIDTSKAMAREVQQGALVAAAGSRSVEAARPALGMPASYASARSVDSLTQNKVHVYSGDPKFVVGVQEKAAVDLAAQPTFAKSLGFLAAERSPVPAARESYAYRKDNDFLSAAENPLSTFAADVDTAGYANVRRMLRAGQRPPADAVRVEELVNYFPYRYAAPNAVRAERGGVTPPTPEAAPTFAAALEVAEAPWAAGHRLVRIGLKAREVAANERGAANLVFLVDVSGSMSAPERLPLVQESLRLLVNRLRPDDRVAIVTYAGASGLALASTPVGQTREVVAAIDAMTPGGSTNGGMGIQLAYDIAKANFVTGGVNRVILCTDGDFNVGVTGEGELVRLVQEKAKSGVFLTVLGFGMGNLKDGMLEAIADKGNGSYGYIDSRREAEKLLGAQVNGTLTTVAKDVKLQVEFNPARVASYRLIGYENRLLAKEDFNNDKVDAGEVGAGHTVTALYEVVPAAEAGGERREAGGPAVDELKYVRKPVTVPMPLAAANAELLTVKVRYKEPTGDVSRKLEFALTDSGTRFAEASGDFKFASAVAAFGMVLRDSPHKGTATLAAAAAWAEAGAADDPGGWRGEFVELARAAAKVL